MLSDRAVVGAAVATGAGAWWARPLPGGAVGIGVVALVVVYALGTRRAAVLCVALAVLASALSARSWAGLADAPTSGQVVGVATLVTDPDDIGRGTRAELRLHGRRVEAWAYGARAAALRGAAAGERVAVEGRLSPVSGLRRAYLLRGHVAARLAVDGIERLDGGTPPARAANAVRRLLLRGVASFPPGQQAMFAGIVLGDDRGQPRATVEEFRHSGLAHLLAVSGQNVAFVLALASPLLLFLGLRARLVAAVGLLALFGLVTRWEPSVMRAEAMAGVALVTATVGRPVSSVRALALAVAGLLVVDPLLVGSIGFLLSVGACGGIVALTPVLTRRRVPLPLAATLAAQAGVAPLLAPVFGGMPTVSTAANLLAVPVAGPLMMWGMGAGFVAGVVGGPVAALLHLPTRLMLAWVEGVAHHAAGLGLGSFGARHLVALATIGAVAFPWRRRLVVRALAGLATAAVCLAAALPACRFGPCASPSATGPSTSPREPWSWGSSTGPPTPSTTRAPTSPWTGFWPGPSSSWPRAPTSSMSAG
ncbi:MAG: ComEC/Rec2 family competence protein [Actinobacteria bacterium]|nr:ComEC/Rec2 family competence protein [Actinomycetota bacterium]